MQTEQRKKLELQLNQPVQIELMFDNPMVGQSQYGEYYLYAVKNGDGATEYSYFAPDEVHSILKEHKKGSKFIISKLAEQKGSKIITKYEVKPLTVEKAEPETPGDNPPATPPAETPKPADNLFEIMLQSCRDAVKIQTELGGLMDAKSIAVSLFIARTK